MAQEVLIIGSGPASWTAALYAARANLNPVLFAGFASGGVRGGQLMTTTEVENFPGFPLGVNGGEMMMLFEEQARRFGVLVIEEDVIRVDFSGGLHKVYGSKTEMETYAVIIATGAYAKRMDIPGDKELWNAGVSACAVCDGALPIFRNKPLAVIGGGDSACEEALFLTKFASKVYLVLRRDQFRASSIMEERVRAHGKIEILFNYSPKEIRGEGKVASLLLEETHKKEAKEIEVNGVFYAIGHTPNTAFLGGQIDLDEVGYIKVEPGTSHTSKAGVFAAGDVHDKRYKQAITAAAMGCMAALDAEKWIESIKHSG